MAISEQQSSPASREVLLLRESAHQHRPARRVAPTLALVAASGVLLAGCSSGLPSLPFLSGSSEKANLSAPAEPAEALYSRADALMSRGKYRGAAQAFENVDREHPYSPFARRALALAAFAHYKDGNYDEAIKAGRRYATLHSGTKDAALAHHVIAMSYFDQASDPKRDQSKTRKALAEFIKLRSRYPDSRYAKQAENRIRISRDILAASEMSVGRYYMREGNHLAAINRYKTVVEKYQTTPHVEEALARLTESYMALGIRNEAQTAAAILGHNFPNSQWYKDSYALLQSDGLAPREDTDSWLSRTWKSTVAAVSGIASN